MAQRTKMLASKAWDLNSMPENQIKKKPKQTISELGMVAHGQ